MDEAWSQAPKRVAMQEANRIGTPIRLNVWVGTSMLQTSGVAVSRYRGLEHRSLGQLHGLTRHVRALVVLSATLHPSTTGPPRAAEGGPAAWSSRIVDRTPWHAGFVSVRISDSIEAVDWDQAKADLAADDFDNGRSAGALRRSFECSQHVALAWEDNRVVGMARLLSDGVCNAYLLDVWTRSSHRRRGIASSMVGQLAERVPGQHIGLQTDDAEEFYASLGFRQQPSFMSLVVGTWLDNDANRLRTS